MNKISVAITICSRLFIFCFWSGVLGLFLFLPPIIGYFKPDKSLTIFTWPLMLDPVYLKQFEKESGIKLHITYYDSSPALLNKFYASKGHGYDLIIADDRTAELLIQSQLVKTFDAAQLPFIHELLPSLRSHYYDPSNEYTIPHYWGLYGIGYDETYFKQTPPATWGLIFNTEVLLSKICMTDDPREAVMIAAQYLFGSIDALCDASARQRVKELLLRQRESVEVYSINRADNLLQAQTCPVACITLPEVNRLSKEPTPIKFMLPQEGGFSVIDVFLLPRATGKDHLVYQFLKYLYKPEVVAHHSKLFGYCSPLKGGNCNEEVLTPYFFKNVISDSIINDLWVEILAS